MTPSKLSLSNVVSTTIGYVGQILLAIDRTFYIYCNRCKEHISECECPDLKERLDSIANSDLIVIAPDVMKQYREQANRNEWPDKIADED